MYDLLKLGFELHKNDRPGFTLKELAEKQSVSTKLILRRLAILKKLGIKIGKKKYDAHAEMYYWIGPPDIEEAPQLKTDQSSYSDYGAELYGPVKDLSKALISKALIQQPLFHFNQAIGICCIADLHLGHPHTDYGAIEKLFEAIKAIPDMYVISLGDLIDNSVNAYSPKGTVNIVDKDGQLALAEYLINKVRDRVLIFFEGNHEARSYLSDHFKISFFLAEEYHKHYGRYGAAFLIELNGKQIKVYCRHKARGHSQYNPLHPATRCVLFDNAEEAADADVLITAHKHESAVGNYRVGAKMRWLIVCGNAVVYDDYADRIGVTSHPYSFPVLVIRETGAVSVYRRFEDGAAMLLALRDERTNPG